jgi:hypothetical protein
VSKATASSNQRNTKQKEVVGKLVGCVDAGFVPYFFGEIPDQTGFAFLDGWNFSGIIIPARLWNRPGTVPAGGIAPE